MAKTSPPTMAATTMATGSVSAIRRRRKRMMTPIVETPVRQAMRRPNGRLASCSAAVCEGALVRGSAEHDANRPFGLRMAWRTGVSTMGVINRFRLLLIALTLPAAVVVAAIVGGLVFAILWHPYGPAAVLGFIGLVVFLAVFVFLFHLRFLRRPRTPAAGARPV